MAKKDDAMTTSMKVDISELKSNIQEANRNIALANSEFKKAAAGMDDWSESADGLSARITQLSTVNQEYEKILEEEKKRYAEIVAEQGENSKAAQDLKIKMNNLESSIASNEKSIGNHNQKLQEMQSETTDADAEIDDLANSMEDAGDAADKSSGHFTSLGDTCSSMGKVAVGAMEAAAVAVAAVGTAAAAAGKAVWDMANDTASAGDAIDKTSQKIGISAEAYQEWDYVFERSGTDVDNLQAGMKTLSGVIADAASGSSTAAEKLSAVGLSIEDLNGKSQDEQLSMVITALQGMESGAERTSAATDLLGKSATDMAAVLNMTAEDTEALKQEAQDYGMVMSNDAVASSAAFEDSLTRMQGTMGGLKNSMTGELLPGITQIIDGFSDLISGNEQAGQEIQDGAESLVETLNAMIPQAVELFQKIADAVLEIAPSVIESLANGIIEAIPELMPVVLQIVTEITNVLVELLPQIIDAGMQLLNGLIDGLIQNLPQLITAALTLIQALCNGLSENLPVLLEAAIAILTALVTGIVDNLPMILDAVLSLLDTLIHMIIDNLPMLLDAAIEIIMAIVDGLIDNLPELIDAAVEMIFTLVDGLLDNLDELIDAAIEIIEKLVDALLDGDNLEKLIDAALKIMLKLATGLIEHIPDLVEKIPQIIDAIWSAITEVDWLELGGNILSGIAQGLLEGVSAIWDTVQEVAGSIWDGFKDFFGINSPSKLMKDTIGKFIPAGIAEGITDNTSDAISAAEVMTRQVASAAQATSADSLSTSGNSSPAVVGGGNTYNYNFTQNNTSPKALTDWDIYRQTNNLLNAVRYTK